MNDADATNQIAESAEQASPIPVAAPEANGFSGPPTASTPVVAPTPGPAPGDGPSDQGQRFAPRNPHTQRLRGWRGVLVVAIVVVALALLSWAVYAVLLQNPLEASGVVQADATAQLNMPTTGPIAAVNVTPGQSVRAGQVLATQDATPLRAKLASDQAKLGADQTALTQLESGPTPALRQQLQSQVAQAQVVLSAAQAKLAQTNQTSNASVASAQAQVQTDQDLLAADQQTAQNDAPSCTTATPPPNCATDQRQVQVDEGNLSAAQTAFTEATANQQAAISAAQSGVAQSSAALATAQAQEAVSAQAATPQQISAAQALIKQDQSAIAADQSAISQTELVAPFAGIVAAVNGTVGEIATNQGVRQPTSPSPVTSQNSTGIQIFPQGPQQQKASTPTIASLIQLNSLRTKIVIEVAETDISQVHVGQSATASLPAFPGTTFPVTVRQILPNPIDQSGKIYVLVDLTASSRAVQRATDATTAAGAVRQTTGFTVDVTF